MHVEYSLNGSFTEEPPTAEDQDVAVDEDSQKIIVLSGHDPDGDPLTYHIVNGPSNGVLSGSAPNLNYTPNTNFSGNDEFTFVVNDSIADSNTATVVIAVNPVNDAPVANNDSVVTTKNKAKAVLVLANDSDVEGDELSIDSATSEVHGTTAIQANNTVIYTPEPDFVGEDSFEYTVKDGVSGVDTATVTISVNDNGGTEVKQNFRENFLITFNSNK